MDSSNMVDEFLSSNEGVYKQRLILVAYIAAPSISAVLLIKDIEVCRYRQMDYGVITFDSAKIKYLLRST